MPRQPDWTNEDERLAEARGAAQDARFARRIARKALREGDQALAKAATQAYEKLATTALKIAQGASPRASTRTTRTREELTAELKKT